MRKIKMVRIKASEYRVIANLHPVLILVLIITLMRTSSG